MTTNRTPEDQALIDALVGALKNLMGYVIHQTDGYPPAMLEAQSALREAGEEV